MSEPITMGIREALSKEFTIDELLEQCDAIDAVNSSLESMLDDTVHELNKRASMYETALESLDKLREVLSIYASTLAFEEMVRDDAYGGKDDLICDLHHIMSRVRSVVGEPWLS